MTAPETGGGPVVVGASFAATSNALLDALDLNEDELPALYNRLRENGFGEALILATCDRTDIWAMHAAPEQSADRLAKILVQHAGFTAVDADIYRLTGTEAATRMFAVASSLESRLLGEPDVLGQVKESHRRAAALGMTGPDLDFLMDAAYGAAKRVRTETSIGERPVSISSAAIRIARDVHGDLAGCRALVIGAGDTGMVVADSLRLSGLDDFVVLAHNDRQAEALARRLGGHHAPMDTLALRLADADIVIISIGDGSYTLDETGIRAALRKRRQKPVFLIDCGLPADIDPAAGTPDGAFLYTLDDLENVAMRGRKGRGDETSRAHAIIADEIASYFDRLEARTKAPLVTDLRHLFEQTRREVLESAAEEDADALTRRLVNRLLHTPTIALRSDTDDATDALVRRLFGLSGQQHNAPEDEENKQ